MVACNIFIFALYICIRATTAVPQTTNVDDRKIATTRTAAPYKDVGCRKQKVYLDVVDGRFKPIPGYVVNGCYKRAKRRGHKFFALKLYKERYCYTSDWAGPTWNYDKKTGGCKKGTGGRWENMKIYEIPDVIATPAPNKPVPYRDIGCYKDKVYWNVADRCYEKAMGLGHKFFAVHLGRLCETSDDDGGWAYTTEAGWCKAGRGSRWWKSQVYEILYVPTTPPPNKLVRAEEVEEKGTEFNLTACICVIIGVVAFISLIIACKKGCKSDDAPSEPENETYQRQSGPADASTTRRSTHTTANDTDNVHFISTHPLTPSVPTAPPPDEQPEPEPDDHLVPKDSTLTDISEGPPRYRAIFPPGCVPMLTDEGLPPPPSYEDSQRNNNNESSV